MGELSNRRVVLRARPTEVRVADVLEVVDEPLAPLGAGQVRVRAEVLSVDAFIRTALDEGSFHQNVPIGGTVSALGVGTIVESNDPGRAVGTAVFGGLGAQTVATVPGAAVQPVDTDRFPPSTYLGALGLTTGLTAYVGMRFVGNVGEGDTVVVSGAAGAVGSVAGQVARLLGAGKVIGIAGGPAKCEFLTGELGFHAAIDYKAGDVGARLDELAPDGIDVFFDNVGGTILDDVLFRIRQRARVVICGAISQYSSMDAVSGPANYLKLAERYSRMEGFTVLHFADRFAESAAALGAWLESGELVVHEHVERGIDRFPAALDILMTGGHRGKLVVDVSDGN